MNACAGLCCLLIACRDSSGVVRKRVSRSRTRVYIIMALVNEDFLLCCGLICDCHLKNQLVRGGVCVLHGLSELVTDLPRRCISPFIFWMRKPVLTYLPKVQLLVIFMEGSCHLSDPCSSPWNCVHISPPSTPSLYFPAKFRQKYGRVRVPKSGLAELVCHG